MREPLPAHKRAEILVSYTCDVRPSPAAQAGIRAVTRFSSRGAHLDVSLELTYSFHLELSAGLNSFNAAKYGVLTEDKPLLTQLLEGGAVDIPEPEDRGGAAARRCGRRAAHPGSP